MISEVLRTGPEVGFEFESAGFLCLANNLILGSLNGTREEGQGHCSSACRCRTQETEVPGG